MKIIFTVLYLLIIPISISFAQDLDTANTYDYGKMPLVYFANKLYWEKHFDKNNHLAFEALSYNSCHVGMYTGYFEDGSIKIKGQYKENATDDWTNLKERGLCSVPVGEWKTYSETGELKNTILFEDGKIIKEY